MNAGVHHQRSCRERAAHERVGTVVRVARNQVPGEAAERREREEIIFIQDHLFGTLNSKECNRYTPASLT